MNNYFDKAVHYLGQNNKNIFIINIGAMDGITFDELYGYTHIYNFKGLYVEPIPYLFERLKENIGLENNKFENSVISDYNGQIEMLMIDPTPIQNGILHDCFFGMSAVYPPKNGLGSEGDRETVEKYGQKINVPCITLQNLFDKHNIYTFDILKIDAEGHDFTIFKQLDFNKFNPKVVRLEWINLSDDEKNHIVEKFKMFNYHFEVMDQDITGISNEMYNILVNQNTTTNNNIIDTKPNLNQDSEVTIVTGIWDIRRENLTENWSRSFDHYLSHLKRLMKTEMNMIIFIEEKYRSFVEENRKKENTLVVVRELDWFKSNTFFYESIQNIRKKPEWYNQSGWLKDSTQCSLEMYNPIVMSKMFLLNDARIMDKFDSKYLIWVDGALTNTVSEGYFHYDYVLKNVKDYFNKFTFVCFPYNGKVEIHGFEYKKMCEYSKTDVEMVARGGIFGGPKSSISKMNEIYYNLMNETLSEGLMGTEESLFTIMTYRYPELIQYYEIEQDGLLWLFFENLKNKTLTPMVTRKTETNYNENNINNDLDENNVGLYVITYNSPNQFKFLIESMLEYDKNFIEKPKKYLLNNSTDLDTTQKYVELCEQYNFVHIKKDNLGITGGRQFIAEHAYEENLDFYFFFEDDMTFNDKKNPVCRNGFNRVVDNLYNNSLTIIKNEGFDFLKLNFSEFYGDNSTQWSWYNVPQHVRENFWPNYCTLPKIGLDPNAPRTVFKNIKSYNGIPYANGEIYLCNWPQVMSKHGNKKCYITTKFQHPFEQTIMSHVYQETKKGDINPGILLITPTEHNRFEFYDAKLRKEC